MENYRLLWKYRKKLIINFFVTAIVIAGITLILPKSYRATAVVVPPADQGGLESLSLLSNLPGNLLGQGTDQISMFRAILESRTIFTNISIKYHLENLYNTENIEETIDDLAENSDFEVTEEGTIKISVSVSTPFLSDSTNDDNARKLSAVLTNEFVTQLDAINRKLTSQQSRSNREFIEKRYNEVKLNLAEAEDSYMDFQEKYGIIALSEQVEAAIGIAADYESELGISEIKYNVMRHSLGDNHPEVQLAKLNIDLLRKKIQSILGFSNSFVLDSTFTKKLFPLFSDIPHLGKKFIRVERDLEVQSLIYEFITQEFERAKIEEARDMPTVQVIDLAIPPIQKHRPRRSLLVLFATFLSSITYVAIILGKFSVKEFFHYIKN
ncbi:hypothetical protein E3V36_05165 [Candidatus Marinimicrobia bacterium MT.SAG.2]|nr:hypothetical protein E3V36_05165 [Candidatus Marinimicrobia bacterium MT.SAG.2]